MRRIVGVLLAAGSSSRFGTNKLLVPLANGMPLAVAAASRLIATVPESIAVVRPGDAALATLLGKQGLCIVEGVDAHWGMGHSLAAGIAAASKADAWLISLADMPAIKLLTYVGLIERLQSGSQLVVPFHADQRGHPVGFAAKFGAELLSLTGGAGARDLFARHAASLTRFDVDDPGILFDVDTPANLAAQFPQVCGLTS